MKEESRFLVGNHIYRIDTVFETITQVGNADNNIRISDLQENQHSYGIRIDPVSGQLVSENQTGQANAVSIPRSVLEEGYMECSRFAENFNLKLSERFGIRLVDASVLKEMEDMVIPLPLPDLPIIEKNGFRYEIDVSLREIRNVDEPFVHVNLDLLNQENGKYIAYIWDDGHLSVFDPGDSTKLEIDQLVKLAPEDVAKVYGISRDQLPKSDNQLRSSQEYLRDRIERGQLPVIRLVDEDYFVDTRLHELRSCNKFWKRIELTGDFQLSAVDDDKEVFLYDYLNRKIVKDFNELTELPKHTQFIVLPDIRTLDPVSAGRKIYNDPYYFLDKYPIQPRMEARLVPIEKTHLAKRIKMNGEKKLQENKDITIKPAERNRKNKGLSF